MRAFSLNMTCGLLLLVMLSCDHKDIVWPGSSVSTVTIKFEWGNAPDASPEGMTLYFYPESSYGESWKIDMAGRDGGTVELPTGDYRMEAYNTDVSGITIGGVDSYQSLKAEARKTGEGERIASVGVLYGAVVRHIEVTKCGVRYETSSGAIKECGHSLIRCSPDSLTTDFTVIVKDIEGGEVIKRAQAFLGGVGSGILLADQQVFGVPSTVGFPLTFSSDQSSLQGKMSAFSSADAGGEYDLQIAVTLTNGKTIARKFNVTSQVMNSPYQRNVLIVIDGLSIPHPGDPDYPDDNIGGIDADVEGWVTIETDIMVGAFL